MQKVNWNNWCKFGFSAIAMIHIMLGRTIDAIVFALLFIGMEYEKE